MGQVTPKVQETRIQGKPHTDPAGPVRPRHISSQREECDPKSNPSRQIALKTAQNPPLESTPKPPKTPANKGQNPHPDKKTTPGIVSQATYDLMGTELGLFGYRAKMACAIRGMTESYPRKTNPASINRALSRMAFH